MGAGVGLPVSPTMARALRMADPDGLVRLRGGFWTYPGCPTRVVGRDVVPDGYVDVRTIDACVRRGLLGKGHAFDAPAHLTEIGREALASMGTGDQNPKAGASSSEGSGASRGSPGATTS